MRIAYVIITSLVLFGCSTKNAKRTSLTKANLTGDVQTITTSTYEVVEESGEFHKRYGPSNETATFDKKGNLIDEYPSYRSRDEAFGTESTFKFDEKGNKIVDNWYNKDGSLLTKTIYKHDKKGNITEERSYNGGGSLSSNIIYKYDKKGNRIEINSYYNDGSLFTKTIYKYDKKGNITEERNYDREGSLSRKSSYKYDEYDKKGNWLRRTFFANDKPRKIEERVVFYY